MHSFESIDSDSFDLSPFRIIGKDWITITAKKEDKVNTMTASWGSLGIMWGMDVANIVVRESRYTKEFLDASATFSLCFFNHTYHSALKYMGAVSGRDEDKIQNARLTLNYELDTPYFDEASTVLLCRKLFAQKMDPGSFLDESIDPRWYKDKDYHTLYVGEITKILAR